VLEELPRVDDWAAIASAGAGRGRRFDVAEAERRLQVLAAVERPVTAATFKYAINGIRNPAMPSPGADFISDIVGA
jgi:hypothetical protein